MQRGILHSLIVLGSFAIPTFLVAPSEGRASEDDAPRVAIQQRKYRMAHELALGIGSMPVDPFQKGWTAGVSYTVHLGDYIAWEVVNANIALLDSTSMRDELINTFRVPREDFAAPRLLATTGLEVCPLYGKMVFLNDSTVHQSLIIGAYGGAIFGDREDFAKTLEDVRPAGGIGIGYRVFLSSLASLRVDLRNFLSFRRAVRTNESFELDYDLLATLSLRFNLWRDDA